MVTEKRNEQFTVVTLKALTLKESTSKESTSKESTSKESTSKESTLKESTLKESTLKKSTLFEADDLKSLVPNLAIEVLRMYTLWDAVYFVMARLIVVCLCNQDGRPKRSNPHKQFGDG
jgi:hypothetical protein